MLRLSSAERKDVSSKIMDLGNLTFGAITLGQAFSQNSFNFLVGIIGFFMWIMIYGIALLVRKGGKIWTIK